MSNSISPIETTEELNSSSSSVSVKENQRPESSRSTRSVWVNEVFDHGPDVPVVSAGYQQQSPEENQRPESSRSTRSAWVNEVFDHGPDVPVVSARRNDPVAMARDVYASSDVRSRMSRKLQGNGICSKIGRAIRGLWGTRQTEDTGANRELYIRTTIRELIVYMCFLITLCVLTFGMTSSTHYYYTKVMQELFIDAEFPDSQNSFRGITSMQDFWTFAEGPLLDGLFWEKYYNNQNVSQDELGYIYYENRLLGIARIRQLKVLNGSCEVHPDFQEEITSCYDSYSVEKEDTQQFGPENGTAWQYHTEEELDGSSHWGLLDYTYSGGGYYQDLHSTKAKSLSAIQELKKNLWVDRGTRVVFFDFTVYNANINLFCVVRLVVEFPATGGAVPSWQFRTVKLLRYVTTYDFFLLGCEGLYLLFILYYIVEEILEISKLRCSYFRSVWNCLDIIIILLSLMALIFNVYRTLSVDGLLGKLLEKPTSYPDFEYLGFWQVQYNNMVAVVVFFAWIKIFKYISFNRTMTQLQSTLSRCSKDIAGFAIMFFIIFLAYAQLGYLVFGTQVKDFSTFPESIFTQFRIILGDFDFHALEAANRVLGPIFFLTYVFFVFFVLLNMFLAIINDTYSEVKAEISAQKSEFEITDYIKRGYNKVLEKLSLKKDRIKDIQEAIRLADLNQDRQLDWEEWRLDLKMRGIPDAEIEALFAKYDQDGDMILNYDEQRRLHTDLEKQKSNINEELQEANQQSKSSPRRPLTGQSSASKTHSHMSYDSDDSDIYEEASQNSHMYKHFVTREEFQIMARRVDRMERSVGTVVSKIDSVIVKLEAIELAKVKRQETVRVLNSVTEIERSGRSNDELLEDYVQEMVKDEIGSATSLRPASGYTLQSSKSRNETIPFSRSTSRPHSRLTRSSLGESNGSQSEVDSGSRSQSGMEPEVGPASDGTAPVSDTQPLSIADVEQVSRPQSELFFSPGIRPRTNTDVATPGLQSVYSLSSIDLLRNEINPANDGDGAIP